MPDHEETLMALGESQGELVGSITHDLKGLLMGFEGGLYLIQSGLDKNKPERLHQGKDTLKRNLARMRRTIGNALYYVKDRLPNHLPLQLREVMDEVKKDMADHAFTLGVELKLVAEERMITSDPLALHAIIVDITEYALDGCHNAHLNPAPSVEVKAVGRDDRLILEITATGLLIDDGVRTQVLGDYYSPREGDRTHLWLFIAHKVIKGLAGTLEIAVDAERGVTRFGVLLPTPQE